MKVLTLFLFVVTCEFLFAQDGDFACWIDPDVTYTLTVPGQDQDWNCYSEGVTVCWLGPIDLGWSFCFYGQTYDHIYINSVGTISFDSGYHDSTPSSFPEPGNLLEPQYNHICPFWSNCYYDDGGHIAYKITDSAFYLNFLDVQTESYGETPVNNFQLIITPSDGILGENNVQFCYGDMQWAQSTSSTSECLYGDIATVGVDVANGPEHIQFGRFGNCETDYDGPFNTTDTFDWLDYRTFEFSVCEYTGNNPPFPHDVVPLDTIFLCQGECYVIDQMFFAPEYGQDMIVNVSIDGSGFEYDTNTGPGASILGNICAGPENTGLNSITIVVTDNGIPAASETFEYLFFVEDFQLPELIVEEVFYTCVGQSTEICCTGDIDYFQWSNGCDSSCCDFQYEPESQWLIGGIGQCRDTVFFDIVLAPPLQIDPIPEYFELCPGDSLDFCVDIYTEISSISWQIYPGYSGEIFSGYDSVCAIIGPGNYLVEIVDASGCEHFLVPVISEVQIDMPEPFNIFDCEANLEEVALDGACLLNEGYLTLYLLSDNTGGWNEASLQVVIENENLSWDTTIYSNSLFSMHFLEIHSNDSIFIYYNANGNSDSENSCYVFNCTNESDLLNFGENSGLVWQELSGCSCENIDLCWNVISNSAYLLENECGFSNSFQPQEFGNYTVIAASELCPNFNVAYNFNYALPPIMSIVYPFGEVLLCGDSDEEICINLNNVSEFTEINWNGLGIELSEDGLCVIIGPFDSNLDQVLGVTATNFCGSVYDEVLVSAQQWVPEMEITQFGDSLFATECDCNYEWSLDGDVINGETGNSIALIGNGLYEVEVENDCNNEGADFEWYVEDVFINSTNSDLSIFPNPTSGYIIVTIGDWENFEGLEVFDSIGQLIWTEKFFCGRLELNATTWPSGLYVLRLGGRMGHFLKS